MDAEESVRLIPAPPRHRAAGLRHRLPGAWLSCIGLLFATPAEAQLSLCNQSLDVLNIAIGYEESGDIQTEGWWSVGVNRCAEVVRQELPNRYYYVYAEDAFGQATIAGDIPMCVDNSRFVIRGAKDCWARGHKEGYFLEVDTKAQSRWTVFLKGAE